MTTAFYDGKDPLNLKCGETGHVLVRIDSATKDVGISALIQSGHVTTDQPAKTTDEGGNVIFDVICPAAGGDCPTSSSILFYLRKEVRACQWRSFAPRPPHRPPCRSQPRNVLSSFSMMSGRN